MALIVAATGPTRITSQMVLAIKKDLLSVLRYIVMTNWDYVIKRHQFQDENISQQKGLGPVFLDSAGGARSPQSNNLSKPLPRDSYLCADEN